MNQAVTGNQGTEFCVVWDVGIYKDLTARDIQKSNLEAVGLRGCPYV